MVFIWALERGYVMDFGMSILWYSIVYVVVTLVGILHTCFNGYVLKMDKDNTKPIKSMYDIKSYAATVKYHALYNIILWPIAAYYYLIKVQPDNLWLEALIIGLSWMLLTIIVDLIGWVLIRHPWAMTWKEMYVDYQPHITLIYVAILVSAFVGAWFV